MCVGVRVRIIVLRGGLQQVLITTSGMLAKWDWGPLQLDFGRGLVTELPCLVRSSRPPCDRLNYDCLFVTFLFPLYFFPSHIGYFAFVR